MPYQYMPGYQPYYQPPMADQLAQLQPQHAQTGGQSMVWVSGEAEAMAYLVAPNSAVALWDSNAPTIYLKQADASGKPSIKVYDLVERTQKPVQASQPPVVEYAPLSRVEALEARLNELTVVKEMPVRTTKKTTTKEDAE